MQEDAGAPLADADLIESWIMKGTRGRCQNEGRFRERHTGKSHVEEPLRGIRREGQRAPNDRDQEPLFRGRSLLRSGTAVRGAPDNKRRRCSASGLLSRRIRILGGGSPCPQSRRRAIVLAPRSCKSLRPSSTGWTSRSSKMAASTRFTSSSTTRAIRGRGRKSIVEKMMSKALG